MIIPNSQTKSDVVPETGGVDERRMPATGKEPFVVSEPVKGDDLERYRRRPEKRDSDGGSSTVFLRPRPPTRQGPTGGAGPSVRRQGKKELSAASVQSSEFASCRGWSDSTLGDSDDLTSEEDFMPPPPKLPPKPLSR